MHFVMIKILCAGFWRVLEPFCKKAPTKKAHEKNHPKSPTKQRRPAIVARRRCLLYLLPYSINIGEKAKKIPPSTRLISDAMIAATGRSAGEMRAATRRMTASGKRPK